MSHRRRSLGWILACIAFTYCPVAHGGALDPRLHSLLDRTHGKATRVHGGGKRVPVIISGAVTRSTLDALGVRWHSRFLELTTGEALISSLPALRENPSVGYVSLASGVTPSLDVSAVAVGVDGLRGRLGGAWVGDTGKDVVVGIIDTGIDVAHEDFINPDGTSRILFIWDQQNTKGSPPVEIESSYGSEWSRAEIESGLSDHFDVLGHGTHVAGIAVGNGAAAGNGAPGYRFVGMAPEADMIVVAAQLREDRILDALAYLRAKADALGKPLVVNMSLNSVSGPHNGMAPLSQAVDAFSGPGRIVVVSAGNSGQDSSHAQCSIEPTGMCDSSVLVRYGAPPSDTLNAFELEGYYPADSRLLVTLETPEGVLLGPISFGETIEHTETINGTVFMAQAQSVDASLNHVFVEVSDLPVQSPHINPPQAGEWKLHFENTGGSSAQIHLWAGRMFPMTVRWSLGQASTHEIGPPATAHKSISVGSYNTKRCWKGVAGVECAEITGVGTQLGEASWFSSHGPTLDGRQKPEISAPGFAVMSSLSGTLLPPIRELWGLPKTLSNDGVHVMQAGTSMSAPHVTGVVALRLAQDPDMSPESLRRMLRLTAVKDQDTGPDWNPALGYGKLDANAFMGGDSLFLPPPPRLRVAPNPFREVVHLVIWDAFSAPGASVEATIWDLAGRRVQSLKVILGEQGEGVVDWDGRNQGGDSVASGIYWIRVRTPRSVGSIKVVRLP